MPLHKTVRHFLFRISSICFSQPLPSPHYPFFHLFRRNCCKRTYFSLRLTKRSNLLFRLQNIKNKSPYSFHPRLSFVTYISGMMFLPRLLRYKGHETCLHCTPHTGVSVQCFPQPRSLVSVFYCDKYTYLRQLHK